MARAGPCPSLHYPPSPQESAPLVHIFCLTGSEWSLTCWAKIRENIDLLWQHRFWQSRIMSTNLWLNRSLKPYQNELHSVKEAGAKNHVHVMLTRKWSGYLYLFVDYGVICCLNCLAGWHESLRKFEGTYSEQRHGNKGWDAL